MKNVAKMARFATSVDVQAFEVKWRIIFRLAFVCVVVGVFSIQLHIDSVAED